MNLRVLFDDWPGLLGVAPYGAAAAAGLSALALFATLLAWPKASWSAWRRARILGTLACFAGLAVALHVWNLLVPRF